MDPADQGPRLLGAGERGLCGVHGVDRAVEGGVPGAGGDCGEGQAVCFGAQPLVDSPADPGTTGLILPLPEAVVGGDLALVFFIEEEGADLAASGNLAVCFLCGEGGKDEVSLEDDTGARLDVVRDHQRERRRHGRGIPDEEVEMLVLGHLDRLVEVRAPVVEHGVAIGVGHGLENDLEVVDLGEAGAVMAREAIADAGLTNATCAAEQEHLKGESRGHGRLYRGGAAAGCGRIVGHHQRWKEDGMITAGFTIENPQTGSRTTVLEGDAELNGNGWLLETRCAPHAGPDIAEHLHRSWVEQFEIISGSAFYRLNGEEKTASAGETIVVMPGERHVHPWNAGEDELVYRQMDRFAPPDYGAVQEVIGAFATLAAMGREGKVASNGRPKNPLQGMAMMRVFTRHGGYDAALPVRMQDVLSATAGRLAEALGYRAIDPRVVGEG